MKQIISIIFLALMPGIFYAQTTQTAKRFLYLGRNLSAEQELHSILLNNPVDAEAWLLLARAYIGQNKIETIQDSLKGLPATIQEEPLAMVAKGYVLLIQNDEAAAKKFFDAVLQKTKQKDPQVLREIARAYVDVKGADAHYAIELLNKAVKRDKKNPELYTLMGDAYNKLSDGSNAYTAYKKALDINPSYARASYRLGKIFTSQKNELYLQYFNDALKADSLYAPALYEMYYHYYFNDVVKAKQYLQQYIAASDHNTDNDYRLTDIIFLNKDYTTAIDKGKYLIARDKDSVPARVYKLIANSYAALHDANNAEQYMRDYFQKNTDTGYLAADYETMAGIYASIPGKEDSLVKYYSLAADKSNKEEFKLNTYKKIAGIYDSLKNYNQQAAWLQKYYNSNPKATNRDLFNWGIARYYAGNYTGADSVFGLYTAKYPDQDFGYYWRARSNVAIDTAMTEGLAIPYYLKVIEFAEKDTTNELNRKRLVESYGYIASYKANHDKDYPASMQYFEKVVALQPGNEDAKKYVGILKKMIDRDSN